MDTTEKRFMKTINDRKTIVWLSIIFSVFLFLIVFTIYYLCSSHHPQKKDFSHDPSEPNLIEQKIKPTSLTQQDCKPVINWFTDARQMYDYQLQSDIQLNQEVLAEKIKKNSTQSKQILIQLSGILNFRICQKPDDWPVLSDDNLVYAAFQLSPLDVQYAENDESLTPQNDLKKLFQTLFCASFLKNGLCFKLYFPNNLEKSDRDSLSEIIYSLQLVLSDNISKRWTTKENHTSGLFLAEYRIADKHCQSVEKQNVRCLSLFSDKSESPLSTPFSLTAYMVKSQFTMSVSSSSAWIESCKGMEHIDIKTENDLIWSSSKTHTQLNIIPFAPDQTLPIWSDENDLETLLLSFFEVQKSDPDSTGTWEQRRIESIKKRLKNRSLIQLISDLEKNLAGNKDQSYNATLSHLIQDYFTAYPEAVYQMPFLIKEGKISNSAVGHIMLALERTGHSQAQSVLKNIFVDNEQAKDHRVKAIVAAGSVDSPTESLTEGLVKIAIPENHSSQKSLNEISSTALLALGLHCHRYDQSGQTDLAAHIVSQIKEGLDNTLNPNDMATYFKAIGNAENTQFFDVVKSYLPLNESSDEMSENETEPEASNHLPTQIAAIMALGCFPESLETVSQFISLFDNERAIIRAAAVDAVSNLNDQTIVTALCKRLPEEDDDTIRRKIIHYLADHTNDDVIATLKNHLDLSNQHPERKPISRDEAEDVYRILMNY